MLNGTNSGLIGPAASSAAHPSAHNGTLPVSIPHTHPRPTCPNKKKINNLPLWHCVG
jgi:hypothetical protein